MREQRGEVGIAVSADSVGAALGVTLEQRRALRTRSGAGSPLHRMRLGLGYSRSRVAGLAGVSERTIARMEEGVISVLSVEALCRVAIVMGCAVTDIAPELGVKLDVVPGLKVREDRKLWKRKLPGKAGAEQRSQVRRKAVEWLWKRVVAQGGKVRSDWIRAEYRDEGEPLGRAAEVLHRARCELGMTLMQYAGTFGWWWVTEHPLTPELPPLLAISDRTGRRELTAEG